MYPCFNGHVARKVYSSIKVTRKDLITKVIFISPLRGD